MHIVSCYSVVYGAVGYIFTVYNTVYCSAAITVYFDVVKNDIVDDSITDFDFHRQRAYKAA